MPYGSEEDHIGSPGESNGPDNENLVFLELSRLELATNLWIDMNAAWHFPPRGERQTARTNVLLRDPWRHYRLSLEPHRLELKRLLNYVRVCEVKRQMNSIALFYAVDLKVIGHTIRQCLQRAQKVKQPKMPPLTNCTL